MGEFGATITFVSNIPGETQTLPSAIYAFLQVPGGEAAALRLVAGLGRRRDGGAAALGDGGAPGRAAGRRARDACRSPSRHAFPGFALDVAFEAPPGVTALFGRSGSGKTTVVNAVAGLLRRTAGGSRSTGGCCSTPRAASALPPHRRRIGYVFQEGRLFPHLTVRQNLRYGALVRPRRARRRRAGAASSSCSGIGAPARPPARRALGRREAARRHRPGAAVARRGSC